MRATFDGIEAGLGSIGAARSRIETATANDQVSQINTAEAASRIMDSDVGADAAGLAKSSVSIAPIGGDVYKK